MNCLEHIIFVTSEAIEKDKITKSDLIHILYTISEAYYNTDDPPELIKLNEKIDLIVNRRK